MYGQTVAIVVLFVISIPSTNGEDTLHAFRSDETINTMGAFEDNSYRNALINIVVKYQPCMDYNY